MSSKTLRGLPLMAGTCSILVLAGCPNAGTAPPVPGQEKFPTASPSAAASPAAPTGSPSANAVSSPAATKSPGATSTGAPSPAPSGSAAPATPKPTTSAPPASGETTILQGLVYDEAGATVTGAVVKLRSLDSRVKFESSVTTDAGNWVANAVPVGVQIETSVTKDGWTKRLRVNSYQKNVSAPNVLNFGGPSNTADPGGPAYFISNFPEVASAVAAAETTTGQKLSYKIKISEPLDADNRRLFERGFKITARPSGLPAADLNADGDVVDAGEPATVRNQSLTISESSTFLNASKRLSFAWNTAGDELTVSFDAPLQRQKSNDLSYRFGLTRPTGAELLKDKEGKVLGFVSPDAGSDYTQSMKKATLKIEAGSTTAGNYWRDTHTSTFPFDIKLDDVKPKLEKVTTNPIVKSVDGASVTYRRVSLWFSEPMRVYAGSRTVALAAPAPTDSSAGYDPLLMTVNNNYRFAIAETEASLNVDMTQALEASQTIANNQADNTILTTLSGFMDSGKPFRWNTTGAANNRIIRASFDDGNPNVVNIDIPADYVPLKAKFIKVLATTSLSDPAGNSVSEGSKNTADQTADNVKVGTI